MSEEILSDNEVDALMEKSVGDEVLFADNASTGVFEGDLHHCVDEQDAALRLNQWYSLVYSSESRFE